MWDFFQTLIDALGPGEAAHDLGAAEMALRAVVVYLFAIAIVRLGNKRFMGRNSAFDLLLGIMLGSVLSRGITGQAPLLPCMVAGTVLLAAHWTMGGLAVMLPAFGPLVKGRPRTLIENGRVDEEAMKKSHVGREDLAEALRIHGNTSNPADVAFACLERNGNISVIPRKNAAEVIEVRVEEGVQVVRVELRR